MSRNLSPSAEDYLKHLYVLGEKGKVTTQALAAALAVAPASVTGMLRKLTDQGLVSHAPYQGAQLTTKGQRLAIRIIRNHRLVELFLHRALGVPLDELHEEAERLEHVISEKLATRIAAWLDDPTHDPHGDPIPSVTGELPIREVRRLSQLAIGDIAIVARVPDDDSQQLRAFVVAGLTPDVKIEVLAMNTALDTLTIKLPQQDLTLSLTVAAQVHVYAIEFKMIERGI